MKLDFALPYNVGIMALGRYSLLHLSLGEKRLEEAMRPCSLWSYQRGSGPVHLGPLGKAGEQASKHGEHTVLLQDSLGV
jgi:hypothetical protein